jgi:hypothetical protein
MYIVISRAVLRPPGRRINIHIIIMSNNYERLYKTPSTASFAFRSRGFLSRDVQV